MAYCKSCGAYIPDGHTKCLACGLDQNQEEEKEYASGSAAQEEEERSRESREASRREEEERSRQRQEENRRWAEAERRRRQQRERSYGADRNDEDYTVRGARPKGYQSNRLLAALSYIPALFLLPLCPPGPYTFCRRRRRTDPGERFRPGLDSHPYADILDHKGNKQRKRRKNGAAALHRQSVFQR